MQGKITVYKCKTCGRNFSSEETPKCPKCGETKNLETIAQQG